MFTNTIRSLFRTARNKYFPPKVMTTAHTEQAWPAADSSLGLRRSGPLPYYEYLHADQIKGTNAYRIKHFHVTVTPTYQDCGATLPGPPMHSRSYNIIQQNDGNEAFTLAEVFKILKAFEADRKDRFEKYSFNSKTHYINYVP